VTQEKKGDFEPSNARSGQTENDNTRVGPNEVIIYCNIYLMYYNHFDNIICNILQIIIITIRCTTIIE